MTAVAASLRTVGDELAGLGTCLRIAWRRSRLFWVLWILILWSFLPATVVKYHELIPDGPAGEATLAGLASNVTMRAMLGQPYDLSSAGGFSFWRVGEFTAVAAGMMAGLGIIRATRAEEEEGRVELVRSGAVGRHAPLTAGIVLSLLGCLALGLLTTAALLALSLPAAGSVAAGSSLALNGAMFVGVGAVFAQVFTTARSARSWTLGVVLGGLFVLRALVDAAGDNLWAQWLMPLDWSALARPFADERWWVYALPTLTTAALLALAYALEVGRDHGAGLVAPRPGRAHARPGLCNAWALALRLQAGGLGGWALGISLGVPLISSLSQSMDKFIGSNAQVEKMLHTMGGATASLTDSFYQAMISILVALLGLMAVLVLQRLRVEEAAGRVEAMLATATSRTTFALSHLVLALVVPLLLLVATGPLLGLVDAATSGDAHVLWTLTKATLCMVPGLGLVLGFAMFLEGWAPRLFPLVWVVLGWSVLVSWIGALLDLPDWAVKLQPWAHLPHVPSEPVTWGWIVGESLIGLGLLVLGVVGYRRRDILGR